jgi:hypothetical protein
MLIRRAMKESGLLTDTANQKAAQRLAAAEAAALERVQADMAAEAPITGGAGWG